MTEFRIVSGCRACGAPALLPVLDLGRVPLANALLTEDQLALPERRFPLTVVFCPACSLVQLRETVDPELLFGHYLYFSSYSETMLAHARELAETLKETLALGPRSLVVEIASNDGYLLRNVVAAGIPALGIEPARNVAAVAESRGVPTLCAFFDENLARRLAAEGKRADAIVANNVLAHVADLSGVAAGIAALLAPRGAAVVEFPYVLDLVEGCEFDTIYHEHLCYFSLHAVARLFADHGLVVADAQRIPIHGGSLRVWLRQAGSRPEPAAAVERLLAEEHRRGMTAIGFYEGFAGAVRGVLSDLARELARRKAAGQSLAAYGASAKGSTLLNVCGIGKETLDFVADRSDVKQGLFTPGNHLPIVPPKTLLERRPDAVLLLTWNFAEEILQQQRAYLNAGGVFVVPLPRVRTVGKEALT